MAHVMKCKLQLNSLSTLRAPDYKGGEVRRHDVEFGAVWEGSTEAQQKSENAIFGEATPSAFFKASIKNDAVAAALIPGKKYYVTFTEAPD